ncbi:OX-2 membrane glycoprotein isoform X1 [Prionailurus iriomotensis]
MERLVFVGLFSQVVTQDEEELLNTPASLRCSLQNSEEVLIVTWQKIKAVSPENMVTFSKNHGVVVQPAYKDKINITQLELKNSTITFWNTTLEDEGCYKCLFNTFGSGKISGKACLTLSVQPTVFLHYKFFEDHVNITCSANARPAPVISWKVSGSGIENSTEILSHPNGTTSVTSVLQVKDPKSQVGKEVICQVLHLGTMTSVRQTLDKELLVFSSTIVKYCFPGHSPGLNLNLIILETSSEPRPRKSPRRLTQNPEYYVLVYLNLIHEKGRRKRVILQEQKR